MEDIDSIDHDIYQEPGVQHKQPKSNQEKSLLSFKIQPGFQCFFQKHVQQHQIPLYDCYDLVMKSHFNLQLLRWPTNKILQKKDLTLQQKVSKLLSRETKHQRIYLKGKADEEIFKANYSKNKQQMLRQLQIQVQIYRRRSQQALEAKRNHFKKIQQQREELLRKKIEQKERRQRVIEEINKQMKNQTV